MERRRTLILGKDENGMYAWVETRLPGGWTINRLAAIGLLRRRYPDARRIEIEEQWHVPFSHRAFKIRFDW